MSESFSQGIIDEEHEEALGVNTELDDVLGGGRYVNIQETADLVIRKRGLADEYQKELGKVLEELPEGKEAVMPLNEKAIANLYMAGHVFGKDFTMEHVVQCLVGGKDVTDDIKFPQKGSRYFKLEIPDGAGLPGRFIVPRESGTSLAEHVANWNQECEYEFRHGELSPLKKKSDLPQWLIDLESAFYVIVEKNEILTNEQERFSPPKLQVADGPTEDDPEGSWLVSTVHYGSPSRRKPRPPREPKWNKVKKDPNVFMEEMIKYQKTLARYQKEQDSWGDEQKRLVFVDLEEDGVGQKGVKVDKEQKSEEIAEIKNDNEALKKMLQKALGEINALKSEVNGINTRMKKKK